MPEGAIVVLATYEITPELAHAFRTAVHVLRAHGRPDLTVPAAVREAIEDWIATLRAEHMRGDEILIGSEKARLDPASQVIGDPRGQGRSHG